MVMLTLAEIVTTDPDSRGYAGMTDAQIADDINEQRHTQRTRVPIAVFAQALIDEGVMLAITQARLDANNAAHGTATLVKAMLDEARENGIETIDMDKSGNDALFDAMETAGLMTAAQRATLEALADTSASLAELNGLDRATHLDIATITGGTN